MTLEQLEIILKTSEKPLLKSELLSLMPDLDFKTIGFMLDQLEAQGKVVVGGKGALWTHNDSKKFTDILESSVIHNG
jgi:hypothetical protein